MRAQSKDLREVCLESPCLPEDLCPVFWGHRGFLWPMRTKRKDQWEGWLVTLTGRSVSCVLRASWISLTNESTKKGPMRRLASKNLPEDLCPVFWGHREFFWRISAQIKDQWEDWLVTPTGRSVSCVLRASWISLTNESTEKGPMRRLVSNTYRKIFVLCPESIMNHSDQWEHRERTNEKVG